jgi:hypothetical protein
MNWNAILGIAVCLALLLPPAVIIYYRLYRHRSLAALMLSYFITAAYNFISLGHLPLPASFVKGFGMINNYLDVPLMLFGLVFFCPIRQKQRSVHVINIAFIAYELVVLFRFGLSSEAITYIMGPGLGLILIYTFYLFARHIKITVQFRKNAGRTLMLAAILFSYGCYELVFYFYYIQRSPFVADIYLLYFIATLVSALLMSAGLHLIRRRMQELQEIRNTRRELAVFFGN